ncbi:MAG: chitobiase/beta-hexosaminidase C-terminal domain-containing protein, partial [Methylocystaceae bacterium]
MHQDFRPHYLGILITIVLLMLFSINLPVQAIEFKDIKSGDSFVPYINYLVNKGVITGFPDGTFRPNEPITRAEMAQMLVKANRLTPNQQAAKKFSDVGSQYWAYKSVTTAVQCGLLRGYPDGTFRPEAPASRAELAIMLLNLTTAPIPQLNASAFANDINKHWASQQIAVTLDAKILNRDSKGYFSPDKSATRSEAAQSLATMLSISPEQNQQDLTGVLTSVKGQVQIVSTTGTAVAAANNDQCYTGDTVITGANSSVQIGYPDGSGFKLNENTKLLIKEAAGYSAISKEGSPLTVIDNLKVGLIEGQIFGALNSTSYDSANQEEKPATTGLMKEQFLRLASLTSPVYLAAQTPSAQLPWYQQSAQKKVRVQVDMPWGVAAIRGTFWMNEVRAGRNTTDVATGEAEVTAGGQTVSVGPGRTTAVTGSGAAPAPPVQMSPQQQLQWNTVQDWVRQTAQDMQNAPLLHDQTTLESGVAEQIVNNIGTNVPGFANIVNQSTGNHSNQPAQVAVPTAIPVPGTYASAQTINLSTTTSGATIYYTTDGSDPTISNTKVEYTSSIPVSVNTIIKAYAVKSGLTDSQAVSLSYIINLPEPLPVAAPTASPAPGTYASAQTINLSTATSGAAIYYTTDNSDPTTSNTKVEYTSPIPVSVNTTIKAYAVKSGLTDSQVVNLSYTINMGLTLNVTGLSRINVDASTNQANAHSETPSLSADGRYVAFMSYATNLVGGDLNNSCDIFVKDRGTDQVIRVNVTTDGIESNGGISDMPQITPNGRFVVFRSSATNLATGNIADDTNSSWDIFVHDRDADGNTTFDEAGAIKTVRVSVNTAGQQVVPPNLGNSSPSISDDGRYVCFYSDAADLAAGVNDGTTQIYVHDRDTDGDGIYDEPGAITTKRVSVSNTGAQANQSCYDPKISGNGRYVTFTSAATNLVTGITTSGIYLHDLVTSTTSYLTQGTNPQLSCDGSYIAFYAYDTQQVSPNDTNAADDVYVMNRNTGAIKLLSCPGSGLQANGSSDSPCISPDGRLITFRSSASNLVPNDTNGLNDVFIYDQQNQVLKMLDVTPLGVQANAEIWQVSPVCANGKYAAFTTEASNLAANDTNSEDDIFLVGIEPDAPLAVDSPDPGSITVNNNVSGNDSIQVSGFPNNTLVKVYDASSGGSIIGQGTCIEGGCWITITGGFGTGLANIYVSVSILGTESSRTIKTVPQPPMMIEGNDFSVDNSAYGKLVFKV